MVATYAGTVTASCHTKDPEEAREHTSRTFSEHDVRPAQRHELDFHCSTARSKNLTVGRLAYGVDTTIDGPAMRDCYHLNLPTSGNCTASQRGQRRSFRAGESGIAFRPDAQFSVQLSGDAWSYHLKVPTDLMERHAAKALGQPGRVPVDFDLAFELGSGGPLLQTVAWLLEDFARPRGLSSTPQACRQLESAILTHLVLTIPSQLQREMSWAPRRGLRAKVADVIAYVDEHVEPELTPADLAAMAGISIRTLQAGFRDIARQSPAAYLRNARLDQVHAALCAGESVTEAATRWGFYHLGRFSQYYRERFGNLPSEDVRRTAARHIAEPEHEHLQSESHGSFRQAARARGR